MEDRFSRPPITVTFQDGKNAAGVEQKRCVGCGDCNAGCNHEAKNSTHMNYLPDAVAHGAQIFTGVAVHSVVRDEATRQWRVRYQLVGLGREIYDAPELAISADIVILSAGTLGSTAILLRSREAGLPVSGQLGQHFTGNGDVLSFAYNTEVPINGIGWGAHKEGEIPPVGPTITGLIDHRNTPNVTDGFVIEEGSLAGPVGLAMMGVLGLAAPAEGVKVPEPASRAGSLDADARIVESLLRGPYHGAMNHTQTYLVMAHDDDGGQIARRTGPAAHPLAQRRQAAHLRHHRKDPRSGHRRVRRRLRARPDFGQAARRRPGDGPSARRLREWRRRRKTASSIRRAACSRARRAPPYIPACT